MVAACGMALGGQEARCRLGGVDAAGSCQQQHGHTGRVVNDVRALQARPRNEEGVRRAAGTVAGVAAWCTGEGGWPSASRTVAYRCGLHVQAFAQGCYVRHSDWRRARV